MKKLSMLLCILTVFILSFITCENDFYPEPDKLCALTFDDGPDDVLTMNILKKLDEHGVKGSFFQIGQKVTENQKAVDAIVERGFEIHNHSNAWDSMDSMSFAEVLASYTACNEAIRAATPEGYIDRYTSFFRPPNLAVGGEMYNAIPDPFAGGIVAGDFPTEYGGTATIEGQLENILNNENLKDGAIILMHDVQAHDYYNTPGLLDLLIPELKKRGFEMAGLGEMFKRKMVDPAAKGDVLLQAAECDYVAPALIQTGNNYRMKKIIEKAGRGEPVTIAYLGGSVTEGEAATEKTCFAYRSYLAFKNRYGLYNGRNVHYVNAGIASSPSTLGALRYKRDVLDAAPSPPDIVITEFAVNDYDDPTFGATYESLVLDILKARNKPVVMLLFSAAKNESEVLWNMQNQIQPIGKAYQLPMISVKDALLEDIRTGAFSYDMFFNDTYHPNSDGHQYLADCITNYFETVDSAAADSGDITLLSEPAITADPFDPAASNDGRRFTHLKMFDKANIPRNVKVDAGSFTGTDNVQNHMWGDNGLWSGPQIFPNNWFKESTEAGDPLTVSLKCKSFFIVYKRTNDTAGFGAAAVSGLPGDDIVLDSYLSWGFGNSWTAIVVDEDVAKKRTITINADKQFTVMAFGYTK